MAVVGELGVYHYKTPQWEAWIEYEVAATDDDPEDPQETSVIPQRIAFVLYEPIYEIETKGGRLDRMAQAGKSVDRNNLTWWNLSGRYKKATPVGEGLTPQGVIV